MRSKFGLVLTGIILIVIGAGLASASKTETATNLALCIGGVGVACCVIARFIKENSGGA